jgi:hypothetical protein
MIVIRFGRWGHYASKHYLYDRIYIRGYIWTPFCIMSLRYKADQLVVQSDARPRTTQEEVDVLGEQLAKNHAKLSALRR